MSQPVSVTSTIGEVADDGGRALAALEHAHLADDVAGAELGDELAVRSTLAVPSSMASTS